MSLVIYYTVYATNDFTAFDQFQSQLAHFRVGQHYTSRLNRFPTIDPLQMGWPMLKPVDIAAAVLTA